MKKFLALALALTMSLTLVACGKKDTPAGSGSNAGSTSTGSTSTTEKKVYNVAYVVNGNLGDKSFFDSAEAGLQTLKADGRITLRTIEMGGLLGSAPVMPVHRESAEAFIQRGGRIPAPLHSLKN